MEKKIGKIKEITFGNGGYQDAMFGVSFSLGGDGWGVGDFWGTWEFTPSDGAKWTLEDQTKEWGNMIRRLIQLCKDAKVTDVSRLKNIPVEITFDGMERKSWRILTEVL